MYLHPAYLPNIANLALMAQEEIIWDISGNFQKQTYRNRTFIATDQGKLLLSIPVIHKGKSGHQNYKDILVDHSQPWMRTHWRGIETAYRTSPFFEYYEHYFKPLFEEQERYLIDFNLKSIEILLNCLQLPMPQKQNETYIKDLDPSIDRRFLINAKRNLEYNSTEYHQVFSDKHGFIGNLSALDLICNEGPSAAAYLKNEALDF